MIDLSYLTEEEQGMILAVLKRDAELKKAEEKRVSDLQKSVRDKGRLKYLTGEWFYETKSKRHRDRIHGSDIIRASMRQKKPVTILELSQIWAERPSFVNSNNQEVFVPPELSGLLEEPPLQQSYEREENGFTSEMLAPVSQSPSKRQNPFNSSPLAAERLDGVGSLLTNGAMEQAKTPDRESLPPSHNNSLTHLEPAQDPSETRQVPPVPIPVPRKRTNLCRSQDSLLEIDGPAVRQASSYTPRGILKHSSSSSSTDSLPFRLACNRQPAPQSPIGLDSPLDTMPVREPPGWLDRKQVRFSSAVSLSGIEGPPEMQDGKELGEHSLLDVDCKTPLEGDDKTGQGDRSDYNEDNDEGYPASLPKDEEEVFSSVGSPNCAEGHTQIQVTGPTNVPVDQPKHDHAEPLDPQVSVCLVADQQPGYHENPSTTRETLRPMSYSKSLDDLTSRTTFSPVPPRPPSLSDSDAMKAMNESVPAFPQEERDRRDSDCASESSHFLGWRRKANSLSNLSLSSGMASMSSVSGSVASVYSCEHGDLEVRGAIQFALNYVQKLGEFHIFVVQCRELAVAEPKKNRSDPYVKCYLLPDNAKMGKKKSSVKKKTLNPTYNEILRFKVTMETLKTQKLNVSVWHNDNFGRNSFLGEVGLDLSEWDFNNTQINEYALKPKVPSLNSSPSHSNSIDHRGEMRVALRFLPKASYSKRSSQVESGEVQVWVKDCKNLPPVRGVIIDPFVKCTILPDSNRKSRQKTRVVKRTANPMFNHTMVYDGLRPEDLREACVEVTVWDHDRLSNHFIGGLRIGLGSGRSYGAEVDWMDSTAEEASLWERMMETQSEWVEEVLPLRMVMMARGTSK